MARYISRINIKSLKKHYAALIVVSMTAMAGCGGGSNSKSASQSVAFSASAYSVNENGTSVDITVTRSGGTSGAVSVSYASADGTATVADNDYEAASGTLNWADGDSNDKTFSVNITDNNRYEGDETITLTLSGASGAELGTATSTLTIAENDVPGTIGFSSSNTYSVAEGAGTASVTLSRTGGSDGDVSVVCSTSDDSALAGSDYTTATNTVSWSHGDSADKTCDVVITSDSAPELNEQLTLTLGSAQYVHLDSTTTTSLSITDDDSVTLNGVVSAPGGSLAFKGLSFVERMFAGFASVFGKQAIAAISDLVSPVPGATVAVYEVDADGNIVGSAVTTATTNSSGEYTLAAPLDAPASKYIVRATGTSGGMDSRVTDTSLAVDPVTDATSDLVTATATDLATLGIDEINQISDEVADLVTEVSTSGTAADISTSLVAGAQADDEVLNVINSTVAPGVICGTVTKPVSTPLESVLVIVRDYGNWVTRAKAKTDSSGNYCVNVPFGDYIVGAINRTGDTLDADRTASEWYTSGGGAAFQIDAEKVSVPNSTQVDINFELNPGIRIHGTVSAYDSGSTEGAMVIVRDYDTLFPVAFARVKADGTYRVNVGQGRYTVMVRNTSLKPYASEYYTSGGGTNIRGYADLIDLSGTSTPGAQTVNFTLEQGYKLSGTVTESSTAVQGVRVVVDANSGGQAERLRTNKEGFYRVWLKPDTYDVLSYGQQSLAVDMSASDASASFSATVAKLPVTIQNSSTQPVSQAKVLLYGGTAGDTYIGNEVSSSDGTLTLYTDTANTDYKVVVRIDSEETHGSTVYDGQTQRAVGTSVDLTPGVTPSAIVVSLPDAGVLKVVVVDNTTNNTPQGNIPVEVRDGGTGGGNRFVSVRSKGDGIALFSLPGGVNIGSPWVYENVRVNGASGGSCTDGGAGVKIVQGMTTTITFQTDSNSCAVGAPM